MKIFKRLLVVLTILFIFSCSNSSHKTINTNDFEGYSITRFLPKKAQIITCFDDDWCIFKFGGKKFLMHIFYNRESLTVLPEDFNLGN